MHIPVKPLLLTSSAMLFAIFSCNNHRHTKKHPASNSVADTVTIKPESKAHSIDYDKTKVIKSVYVTDRTGAEIKQEADIDSETLGTYQFGTKLEVIEETEEWFGVRDRITREFVNDGSQIERTAWEKVYVLKSKTGPIDKITLIPSELNIISSLNTNQKAETFETDKELKGFLKIELIDKQLFESKRGNEADYLLADTSAIKKVNGIIELKCQHKTVKYIDKPDDEENRQVFDYVGQLQFLNKYLIGGSYYEGLDYRFIDKITGEETQVFGDYPNVSADKKHIICIYTNPYDTTADLALYSINNNEVKHIVSASFKYWMPTVEPQEMFWGKDNYLYLAVNHVNSFWKEDGHLNSNCQYIRIKIL